MSAQPSTMPGAANAELARKMEEEAELERAAIAALTRLARARHKGECVLVRVEMMGADSPLGLLDFDPRTVSRSASGSTSSAVPPSAPSTACG